MLAANTGVWYDILIGGKASVNLTGGVNADYIMVTMRPLTTYLGLLIDAPNKIPYHVDVISIDPRQYMLTDLKHRDEHTDAFIVILNQIYPPTACILFYNGPETEFQIPFCLKPPLNMTQEEVEELYIKAEQFVSKSPPFFFEISHFYRNKSEEYFTDIMVTDGVMHKYDKNWGGDQASTLNKQVQGLFFSTTVDPVTRLPPDMSYFGPLRLYVPTSFLLNNNINMYFSDFYCHRVNHKVQLVLTVKGSPTDCFCRQRLMLVNQEDNPFLTRVRKGFSETVRVTANVKVELFYTEDVPIKDLMCRGNVYFTTSKQKGNALVMVNGIPKNRNCRICNLDCFLLAHNMIS